MKQQWHCDILFWCPRPQYIDLSQVLTPALVTRGSCGYSDCSEQSILVKLLHVVFYEFFIGYIENYQDMIFKASDDDGI